MYVLKYKRNTLYTYTLSAQQYTASVRQSSCLPFSLCLQQGSFLLQSYTVLLPCDCTFAFWNSCLLLDIQLALTGVTLISVHAEAINYKRAYCGAFLYCFNTVDAVQLGLTDPQTTVTFRWTKSIRALRHCCIWYSIFQEGITSMNVWTEGNTLTSFQKI